MCVEKPFEQRTDASGTLKKIVLFYSGTEKRKLENVRRKNKQKEN